ncbi:hypothetical protein JWG41_05790 [Leptospira sp. 201903075]|uniref:hypothetical protein n=1 Tax=Leptospira chreensis TaxID=2810035 RepID=UPI0019638C14|nr:hypothetical protein [Leptospira chreensis]MBM9589948.1 hypothetical protein [Leptospira chreensis]
MQLLRSKKLIAIFGFSTLFVSLIGLFIYPSQGTLSEGFRTPIIAFELAQSTEDLNFLTGSGEMAIQIRSDMRAGQNLDIVFPFLYAGLIFCLILFESKRINWLAGVGLFVSVTIVPFDLYENYILDQILFRLDSLKDVSDLLPRLEVATWWKWGAIGIAMVILSILYFIEKQRLNGFLALFAGLSIFCTWVSCSNGFVAEIMMGFVSFFFIYFGIRSLVLYFQLKKTGSV